MNPVYLYLSCVLREKTKNTMERYQQVPVYRRFTYQSLFILSHSYVSIFLPFCAAGDFLWGFSVAKTAPVCSILQVHIYFFYAFLIFYNFFSLTIYFQKGGLYIRPVSPTSIALITGVEKKVHISAAQQRKRKVSFLIINSVSRKTLRFLCKA